MKQWTISDVPIGAMVQIWYYDEKSDKDEPVRPFLMIITNHIGDSEFEYYDIEEGRYDKEDFKTLNGREKRNLTEGDPDPVMNIVYIPEINSD